MFSSLSSRQYLFISDAAGEVLLIKGSTAEVCVTTHVVVAYCT